MQYSNFSRAPNPANKRRPSIRRRLRFETVDVIANCWTVWTPIYSSLKRCKTEMSVNLHAWIVIFANLPCMFNLPGNLCDRGLRLLEYCTEIRYFCRNSLDSRKGNKKEVTHDYNKLWTRQVHEKMATAPQRVHRCTQLLEDLSVSLVHQEVLNLLLVLSAWPSFHAYFSLSTQPLHPAKQSSPSN